MGKNIRIDPQTKNMLVALAKELDVQWGIHKSGTCHPQIFLLDASTGVRVTTTVPTSGSDSQRGYLNLRSQLRNKWRVAQERAGVPAEAKKPMLGRKEVRHEARA